MAFPVDDHQIAAAEARLARALPSSLRNRLKRNNGGDIAAADQVWTLFPVRDESDRRRLARTANDIVRETSAAREWLGFSKSAIAIGANGSGDLLVLLEDSDQVFLWEHETAAVQQVDVDWN